MTAPKRIWICAWGGNWSPHAGGTQEHEYVRADIHEALEREKREAAMDALIASGHAQEAYEAQVKAEDALATMTRERDEAYAKGYGDCENETSLTEIGKTNEFLHGQIAKYRAALADMTRERDEARAALATARAALHGAQKSQ